MQCRICGNSGNNKVYKVREMMFGFRDVFTYFECSACGCLQIENIPEDMSRYYPNDYAVHSPLPETIGTAVRGIFKGLLDSYLVFGNNPLAGLLNSRFPGDYTVRMLTSGKFTKRSRILDVGCGSGVLLCRLKNAGFENLLGVDPYIEGNILYKNGLRIMKSAIQGIDGKWDLIMFQHSFEHIADPLGALQTVVRLLNDDGMCLVRIPTVSSFAWKHYRENWVQLDAPRHFFLHSAESIKILCSKAAIAVADITYDSNEFQFWGSEQYMKDIPLESEKSYGRNPANSVFSKSEIASFKNRARELNASGAGDQAAFCLVKI